MAEELVALHQVDAEEDGDAVVAVLHVGLRVLHQNLPSPGLLGWPRLYIGSTGLELNKAFLTETTYPKHIDSQKQDRTPL